MKKIILTSIMAFGLAGLAQAQAQSWGDIFRGVFGQKSEKTETPKTGANSSDNSAVSAILSQTDAEAGLKQALVVGAKAVSAQLSVENGYFGDQSIQIPLPGRLGDAQKQLSRLGLSAPLDDLQLRMNRAAETAAPFAVDLVIDAVENLTIEDAISLVRGGETSATDLLRLKTYDRLELLLRPHVVDALEGSGALKMADDLTGRYSLDQYNLNPKQDLIDHSVDKALDGLFFYLAKEEKDIRNNPVDRTTELLRRVFGG